jgi:hypothetical protein
MEEDHRTLYHNGVRESKNQGRSGSTRISLFFREGLVSKVNGSDEEFSGFLLT